MCIHLLGLATAVFITTCVVISAIRWFHMCQPYGRNPRYYYPGRPFVASIYLNALILLPYALYPESADAWYLARLYFLPSTLLHFIILLYSYFGNIMQWRKWCLPVVFIGGPVALALLAAFVLSVWPGEQLADHPVLQTVSTYVLHALGTIMTGVCVAAMLLVMRWSKRFKEEDFSNPADFPVTQAYRWLVLVVINLALCWTGALCASRTVMAVIMLLLAASSVVFIISALHPNRNRPMPENEEEESPEEEEETGHIYQRSLTKKRCQEILSAIKTVVEEQQAFKDAHLTLQDVADRSGYNRSYVSGLIKSEMGGFFTYVNSLRLQNVEAYLQDNPDATIQEAAEESGFVSRKAYYSVKNKLQNA